MCNSRHISTAPATVISSSQFNTTPQFTTRISQSQSNEAPSTWISLMSQQAQINHQRKKMSTRTLINEWGTLLSCKDPYSALKRMKVVLNLGRHRWALRMRHRLPQQALFKLKWIRGSWWTQLKRKRYVKENKSRSILLKCSRGQTRPASVRSCSSLWRLPAT